MAIVTREAGPDDYTEAGRITAEAYREFVPPDDDGDWERYLVRLANVGERATTTTVLVAIDEGRIIGCVTLELESRVRDGDGTRPSSRARPTSGCSVWTRRRGRAARAPG